MDVLLIRSTEQSLTSMAVRHLLTVKHSNVLTHSGAEARFSSGASEPLGWGRREDLESKTGTHLSFSRWDCITISRPPQVSPSHQLCPKPAQLAPSHIALPNSLPHRLSTSGAEQDLVPNPNPMGPKGTLGGNFADLISDRFHQGKG